MPNYTTASETSLDTFKLYPIDPGFTSGPHLLQSSDNMYFKFNLNALSPFSSFFSSLASLPLSSTDNLIPLPSASTRSLRFMLNSINCVLDGCRSPTLPLPSADEDFIDELLTLSDAYDVPIIPRVLLDLSKTSSLDLCKLDQFVLARLCSDSDEVNNLSTLGQLVSSPTHTLSWWAEKHLELQDHEAVKALTSLNARWAADLKNFQACGYAKANELEFFNRACHHTKCDGKGKDLPSSMEWYMIQKVTEELRLNPILVTSRPCTMIRKVRCIECKYCYNRVFDLLHEALGVITCASYTLII